MESDEDCTMVTGLLPTQVVFETESVRSGMVLMDPVLQAEFAPELSTYIMLFCAEPTQTGRDPESKEIVAGYWVINVKSREEAVEWAKRVPAPGEYGEGEIEVRQFYELEDFAPSPTIEHHREIGQKLAQKKSR